MLASTVAMLTWAAGCRDEVMGPGTASPLAELADLGPGIHPVLAIPGLETAAPSQIKRVRVHLVEVAQEERVASWQGVLRYDPEVLEVLDGTFGDGLVGAWHVVEPGVLRFAGIAIEGLRGGAALDLTVRAARVPAARDLLVVVEEVVGAEGFVKLTERVVQGQGTRVISRELGQTQ